MGSKKAEVSCKEKSVVAGVINFKVIEHPQWRVASESENLPSISEMVQEIVAMQERWASAKETIDPKTIENVERSFLSRFIYHVNTEEEHGCQGSVEDVDECLNNGKNGERTLPEQETINIREAYMYLKRVVDEEEESWRKEGEGSPRGLLEPDLFKNIHKIILERVPLRRGQTPPGQLSRTRRFTTYEGETYNYQNPPDMEKAVQTLLDQYNSLVFPLKNEQANQALPSFTNLYQIFKISSWFIFEMLDLHPFGDGNGRLCRLLCSYLLSVVTPFPTPIYNIWSSSRKKDYVQALVDTRKEYERKPRSLAAMIIECNWCGWKKFLNKVGVEFEIW